MRVKLYSGSFEAATGKDPKIYEKKGAAWIVSNPNLRYERFMFDDYGEVYHIYTDIANDYAVKRRAIEMLAVGITADDLA